ncbi:MAG: orotidine-5'-phosphate decarboxylase [Planctomycetaceae bacterium]|nr:orotidine-5'-phosphate decarboxylase [Planctomycetaceae bacterium]
MHSYVARLHAAIRSKRTPALVGLDPRWADLPAEIIQKHRGLELSDLTNRARAFEEFSRRIIDVVAPLVPAVKPQAAFFEECGPAGVDALARVILHGRDAGLIVICDAKRGDIGTTSEAYARAYLAGADPAAAPFAADALTVNPYLGSDTLAPFCKLADERGAGIYVLVRTSNPGAGTFQDLATDGRRMFEHVADLVESLTATRAPGRSYGSVGAVVGATYPRELAELRARMPHVPLLVPGYGSQGGSAADTAAAFDADGLGGLVNSSRGIIFAYRRPEYVQQFAPERWEDAVAAATRAMIADLAAHTPAGRL